MNKIILVGKAASGKDYVRKMLESKGGKYGVSCTSRSAREGESEKDYIFVSKEDFEEKIKNNEFVQHCEFNGNYYGTLKKTFEDCDVFVMSPEGISKLSPEVRNSCTVMFVHCDQQKRVWRMMNRSNNKITKEEIKKRIEADDKLFAGFEDFDLFVENSL